MGAFRVAAEEEVAAVAGNPSAPNELLPAARAIVIHNNRLLVMRRNKFGKQYMVIPGGRIEPGEKPEEALLREMAEETMVTIANPRLVFIEEPNDNRWGTQYLYLCDYVSGEPQLHPDSDEMKSNKEGGNLYEPGWIDLDRFPDKALPFRSSRMAEEMVAAFQHGFPDTPKRWILDPPVVE